MAELQAQIAAVNARMDELARRVDRVQELAAFGRELARARLAAEIRVFKDTGAGS